MLIAIMNDTYTNVMEVEAQSSRIEKINILSDFRLLLMQLDLDMNFQYIFTVKKKVQINDDDNLENQINKLFHSIEGTSAKIASDQNLSKQAQFENYTRITDDMQVLKEGLDRNRNEIVGVKSFCNDMKAK